MALPDYGRVQNATIKTFKSSGGDAAITLASLASNSARQSAKLDLGSSRAPIFGVKADVEIGATPTAGNTIDLYWAPSTSGTASIDNPGNISGSDAVYSGYASNNIDASLRQLFFIGSFVCTSQSTPVVQKAFVGMFTSPSRYGSLVVYNRSGAAIHSSDSNTNIVFMPVEDIIEDV
jgi:hypothetical protein